MTERIEGRAFWLVSAIAAVVSLYVGVSSDAPAYIILGCLVLVSLIWRPKGLRANLLMLAVLIVALVAVLVT